MEAVIGLTGIKVTAHIGVGEEERSELQTLEIDASLTVDIRDAVITDDIAAATDYVDVIKIIEEVAGSREYKLVETLAYQICREVVNDPKISAIRLKVIKHPALLQEKVESVSVEIGPLKSIEPELHSI